MAPDTPRSLVLIVDDSATSRMKLSIAIRNLGHHPVEAVDGEDALARLAEDKIDLVILDIVMPRMDGFEVLRRMADDPRLREIPVLVLSSLEDIADAVQAIELGAADFLTKSFDPVLLRARVTTCLERKRLRDQELEYLREVDHLIEAARVVEVSGFDPERLGLDDVADRRDALGDLARVFRHMAGEIHRREVFYRRQITLLKGAFLLLLVGVPYGLVPSLSRMLATTDLHPLGLAAWVVAGNSILMLTLSLFRGRLPAIGPGRLVFALRVGLVGTLLPQVVVFAVAAHLTATVLTIVLALESVLVFIIAALLGFEKADFKRFVGLCLGFFAVLLIILPEGSGLGAANVLWLLVALFAALLYAGESILMAAAAEHPDDAYQTVTLIMTVSAIVALPLAHVAGVLPPVSALVEPAGVLILCVSLLSAGCTVAFVVAVRQTGAVFASQYTTPMTLAGVLWAMLILGEMPTVWLWFALACMLLGLVLVRPRSEDLEQVRQE